MPNIIIYTAPNCSYCERAKQLFKKKGASFEEIRLDLHPEKRDEMLEKSGLQSVPQIFIGEKHIGGFDDLYALDVAGGLDPLLKD